jgi:hypothetical protein
MIIVKVFLKGEAIEPFATFQCKFRPMKGDVLYIDGEGYKINICAFHAESNGQQMVIIVEHKEE